MWCCHLLSETVATTRNYWEWSRIKEAVTGGAELHDKPWSGCTFTAMMPHDHHPFDELILMTVPLQQMNYSLHFLSVTAVQCNSSYWRAWLFHELCLLGATSTYTCPQIGKEENSHWSLVLIQNRGWELPVTNSNGCWSVGPPSQTQIQVARGSQIPGTRLPRWFKFCMVVPNICGSFLWN